MRTREGREYPWPGDPGEGSAVDRLIPYAKNSRTHSEAQIAQLAASMKEWGWTNPVLADEGPRRRAGGSRASGVGAGRSVAARPTSAPLRRQHGRDRRGARARRRRAAPDG